MSSGWDAAGAISQYLNLGASPSTTLGPLLDALATAVQNAVEEFLGRTIQNKEYVEAYDGTGRKWLPLRHDPVTAIDSVTLNGSALTVQDPAADPVYPPSQVVLADTKDTLYLTNGTVFYAGYQNIIVTYSAGLTDAGGGPPSSVQFAIVYWAAQLFRDRDRLNIQSQGMQGQTTSYIRAMPDFVKQMLAPFKRPIMPAVC